MINDVDLPIGGLLIIFLTYSVFPDLSIFFRWYFMTGLLLICTKMPAVIRNSMEAITRRVWTDPLKLKDRIRPKSQKNERVPAILSNMIFPTFSYNDFIINNYK